MLLADLLDEHDTLTRHVNEFDRYIANALPTAPDNPRRRQLSRVMRSHRWHPTKSVA